MEVIKIEISKLANDPNNARKHSDKNLKAIKGSLAKFGQQKPIVIDSKNVVIAGNGTLEAAKQLGWTHINAVVTELDDLGKMAFALADNKTSDLSEFDDDILKEQLDWLDKQDFDIGDIGFMDYEIQDESKGNDGLTDPDDVPEVPQNVFGVKRGDVWILGNHRLMCGDSTDESDVAKLMNGKKANLMFTDPPYGVSYADKNAYLNTLSKGNCIQVGIKNDHMKPEEMNEFWIKFLTQAHNILLDNSSYYICSPQGGDLMMMMSIIHAGFQLKHMLIWVKNNHVLGRCDYNYKHEPILYGWKEKGTHKFYGNGKYKTSVWEFNKPLKNDLHPTMKPVELCEEGILNSSAKSDIVYDPFCGSGSTLIACEKTGRTCYGCELDEHYCSVIIKRYIDFVGTSDEVYLVENGEKIRLSEVQKMREIIC